MQIVFCDFNNMFSCNWNAPGPAFLWSSDSVVEELLFLVFQPAICRAIWIRMANTVGDGVVQSRHFGWQPVLELTCDHHVVALSWLQVTFVFFLNWKNSSWRDTKFLTMRTLSARQMADWKTKNNNSSTTESELWRNPGRSAFQLQENTSKSDKIWCAYVLVNCVGLRTFWTPLISDVPPTLL